MGFSNLNQTIGMASLDRWVQIRAYIDGYRPSQADVVSFKSIQGIPSVDRYPHAHRWYNHIMSYQADFPLLPGNPLQAYTAYGPMESIMQPASKVDCRSDESDDDENPFGSESEAEDPEVVTERERLLKEYNLRKAGKLRPAAKSIITLDIKPHGDEIDMDELKDHILRIAMNVLVWGGYKFVPVGYGIRKLQINVVVEDERVSMDELEVKIVDNLPDHVQSMDVAAMQKL